MSNIFNTAGTGEVNASSGSTFLEGTYKGTVGLGQFRATLSIIIAIVICIVLAVLGLWAMLFNTDHLYMLVDGNVVKSECITQKDSSKCELTVGYKIDGQDYSKTIITNVSEKYFSNEPVKLWVTKSDYTNIVLASGPLATFSSSAIGFMLILVAIMVFGLAYLNYYMTYNYEVYASTSGIGALGSLLRGV